MRRFACKPAGFGGGNLCDFRKISYHVTDAKQLTIDSTIVETADLVLTPYRPQSYFHAVKLRGMVGVP